MEIKFLKPYGWDSMTEAEKHDYVERLRDIILQNRYIYYVLDKNIITDFEYDYLERMYEHLCNLLNIKPDLLTMVGWNPNYAGAKEAMEKVLQAENYHIED